MALVWAPEWDPPVETGTGSYLRILGRKLATGEKVELFGYGPNAHDGSGSAVHRRSNAIIGVDSSTIGNFGIKTVSGEGRVCIGDSGGPAVATSGPYPLLAGVASAIQRSGSNKCPSPGQWQYFAQAGGGAVRQCGDGNVAGDHSCWIAETIRNDPDTPWYNHCYRTVFQGYEMQKCWGWNF
jgi:hypothetical protein